MANISLHLDSFNIRPKHNPDGIGNCLQQPGQIRNNPNIYHRNIHPLIKFCSPWLILLPWQSQWGCWPSRRCHGFCIVICQFIVPWVIRAVYRDSVIWTIYRDTKLIAFIGTVQKHMPTPTQPATKSTSGPLAKIRHGAGIWGFPHCM